MHTLHLRLLAFLSPQKVLCSSIIYKGILPVPRCHFFHLLVDDDIRRPFLVNGIAG